MVLPELFTIVQNSPEESGSQINLYLMQSRLLKLYFKMQEIIKYSQYCIAMIPVRRVKVPDRSSCRQK